MFKKNMLKFFKKEICNHDYEYLDKDIPNMLFPALQSEEYYVFKCNNCGEVTYIHNHDVINKIKDIFLILLNEEMDKPMTERLSNKKFMDKVWNSYSDNEYINNCLRRKLNANPITLLFEEIRDIDEKDILSLNFRARGAFVDLKLTHKELSRDWEHIIAKDKKGKLKYIRKISLERKIKDEISALKSKYLRKGIKMQELELQKEATIKVCSEYNIQYNDDYSK